MKQEAMNSAPKSLLYWLCGAFALALIVIGVLAIIAPISASMMFGVPATTAEAVPWVRLAGIRDIALGLIFCAITALKQSRATGILMLLTAVVPATDAATVFLQNGLSYGVFIHGSSIVFMLIVGTLLLRRNN
jgi:hypothetical protein